MMRIHYTTSNYLLTLALRLILIMAFALFGYLFIVKVTAGKLIPAPVVVADDETDHYIYYAVYTAVGGQQSTLALNNPLHREQNVRVTLYNRHGEALVVPDIGMAPNQNLYFNIADWIAESGQDGFSEGRDRKSVV